MKLGNLILIVILAAIGYHVYSTLQAPPPPPAPVAMAVPTPAPVRALLTPAPVAPAPVASAPVAFAPVTPAPVTPPRVASASPTPSANWIYSVTSTPYDQISGPKSARKR